MNKIRYKIGSINWLFHRQIWHFLLLLILVWITWTFSHGKMSNETFLNIKDVIWFWLAVSVAILHQILVWLVWRIQLGWKCFTKWFGSKDLLVWKLIFFPLLIARPLLLFGLAKATQNTLNMPNPFNFILAGILLIPGSYTIWSIYRYFGFTRAIGADHFRTKYRKMPLVKKGAFRINKNAMYSFAFLLLWSIALFNDSLPALVVALFQHLSIWVHYHCTEKPDMKLLYHDKNN